MKDTVKNKPIEEIFDKILNKNFHTQFHYQIV